MAAKLTVEMGVDTGDIELKIRFEDARLSAEGGAWFSASQIADFSDRLERYPLDSKDLPMLVGGYWNSDGSRIAQEHIRLLAMPVGNQGRIELSIFLGIPSDQGAADALKYVAATRIAIYYSEAEAMAKGFRSLASTGGEATFTLGK